MDPTHLHRKVSTYAMDVRRKISVREIHHAFTENNHGSITDIDKYINDGIPALNREDAQKKSANNLISLIEERTREKRKKLAEKFISALTLHGYAQFHEAKGFRKVLWALILAGIGAIIIRLTYLSYRSENYYKQVIEFETKKVQAITFPTVTICNALPMYTQAMRKRFPIDLSDQQFKDFYYNVFSNRWNKPNTQNKDPEHKHTQDHWLSMLYEKGYRRYKDILELFEQHDESDADNPLVKRISERHRCMYENQPCAPNFFKTVYRFHLQSLCRQFNHFKKGKPGLISTGTDIQNGLFMLWDISGENYFRDDGMRGLLLEIHPSGTPHHLVEHRRTIFLQPGVYTHLDIEETETKMLPNPFKPFCEEQEPKIVKALPYSKSTCELECFLEAALANCGCVPDQFEEYTDNMRVCTISEMKCVFNTTSKIHCHECPMKCNVIDYKISTSHLGIGNNLIYKTIRETPGWKNKSVADIRSYINENIVGFRIGFRSLFKQIRRYKEAVPWYERVSMLGGMMGLLIGCSVVTGFELLFFLFDYCYITIKYRCTKEYLTAVLPLENVKTAMQKRSERDIKHTLIQ